MRQFLKFLTKLKSFWKFYRDYEYDGETVEFIVENYQDVLQNRTKMMSKPTYYAADVIMQIDNWYDEMGYCYIERRNNLKYNYDKFKTALGLEELAFLIWESVNVEDTRLEYYEEYLEKEIEESEND